MDIGLNICDGVRVKIGDSFEDTIKKLDDMNIKYNIPYMGRDVLSDNIGEQSVIIFLEEYGVELNVVNDEVTYIRTSNINSNAVFKVDVMDKSVNILKNIIKKTADVFEISSDDIILESFEGKNLNTTLKIRKDKDTFIRINIIFNMHNETAHIHTIRLTD